MNERGVGRVVTRPTVDWKGLESGRTGGGDEDMTTQDGHQAADTAAMSTGQLIASIREDLSSLVRDEVELAKAEMRESAARAGAGGALGAIGLYLIVLATVLLAIAAAYGLTGLGLHPGWAF